METCSCYHETEEIHYLTEFGKGAIFAQSGVHINALLQTVGKCYGTRELDVCNCGGGPSKCDFYPEKRSECQKKTTRWDVLKEKIQNMTAEEFVNLWKSRPESCSPNKDCYDPQKTCSQCYIDYLNEEINEVDNL